MLFHSTIFSLKYKEEYTIQTYIWDFGVQKIIYVLITTYRDHTIQVGFTNLASIGDFQVSLITVQKPKKYFLQELFPYNTNSAKNS